MTPPYTRVEVLAETRRLLAVIGLWGVAVTQPILDIFGKSPETFVFRNADGADLVWFALAVALAVPLAIWLVGLLVGLVWPDGREGVHATSLGAIGFLAAIQILDGLPLSGAAVVALVPALAVTVAVIRYPPVHLWTQIMVVLPIFAVSLFLVSSDASAVLDSGGFDVDRIEPSEAEPPPSVILLVLDELPTSSIIDHEGAVDATRFPNLASLAEDATWYRNATTLAGWTTNALPSLLTGNVPTNDLPFWTEHPDNLFRLLAPTHDLVVSESLTRLCPIATCGERPTAPVAGDDAEPPAPERVDADLWALFGDVVDVVEDRIRGREEVDRFDDFAETLLDTSTPTTTSVFAGEDEVAPEGRSENIDTVAEPRRLTEFLDALVPADRPVFGFLHLELPHQPWVILPDGSTHGGLEAAGLPTIFHPDAWTARVARQMHLLQAGYTDALVGRLLDHLRSAGLYEDSLVIVTSDHGIGFPIGQNGRTYTPTTAPGIAWVPLLVKAPGQTSGRVDDANVLAIDVVPTIADDLGLTLGWEVDGTSLNDLDDADRGDIKPYWLLTNFVDGTSGATELVLDDTGFAAMLDRSFGALPPGADPVDSLYVGTALRETLGQRFEPAESTDGAALSVHGVSSAHDDDGHVVLVGGGIDGATDDLRALVAVVDDHVVAASEPTVSEGGGTGFALVMPVDERPTTEPLRLGAILADGSHVDLGPLDDP